MIGILCSDTKAETYSSRLQRLFKSFIQNNDNSIVVFTIDDIDLIDRKVYGYILQKSGLKNTSTALPPVIFNFSLQHKKNSIAKMRFLTRMQDISIINNVNRFNQPMIKQILLSSGSTAKYILPFNIYDRDKRDYIPADDKSYVVIPEKGSSMSKVIYGGQRKDIEYEKGSRCFKNSYICDYIDAVMEQKRWVFMEIPEMMEYDNMPVSVRIHMQRGNKGRWTIIGSNIYPEGAGEAEIYTSDLDYAALKISDYIGRFMPEMGICFVDLILDAQGKAYFLHFGGFDESLFYIINKKKSAQKFYNNLLAPKINKAGGGKGGRDYVG
ncbi:hypothetical protein OXPF_26580 [Oxobacter pfennigii]|uniref:ATP-grasp domain-containing protein n=1 Tax=Oxobacter pfennigii TaxID=36849 RepID=A0A0P8WZ92_9CLOT|nr:hypothetical protein [Oxobacter pfennigii]KPU43798.1 hypothetical protein OXPF_26580 [Oxobacter pfennigii]